MGAQALRCNTRRLPPFYYCVYTPQIKGQKLTTPGVWENLCNPLPTKDDAKGKIISHTRSFEPMSESTRLQLEYRIIDSVGNVVE